MSKPFKLNHYYANKNPLDVYQCCRVYLSNPRSDADCHHIVHPMYHSPTVCDRMGYHKKP